MITGTNLYCGCILWHCGKFCIKLCFWPDFPQTFIETNVFPNSLSHMCKPWCAHRISHAYIFEGNISFLFNFFFLHNRFLFLILTVSQHVNSWGHISNCRIQSVFLSPFWSGPPRYTPTVQIKKEKKKKGKL